MYRLLLLSVLLSVPIKSLSPINWKIMNEEHEAFDNNAILNENGAELPKPAPKPAINPADKPAVKPIVGSYPEEANANFNDFENNYLFYDLEPAAKPAFNPVAKPPKPDLFYGPDPASKRALNPVATPPKPGSYGNMAAKEIEESYLLYEEARNNEKIAQQEFKIAAKINDILNENEVDKPSNPAIRAADKPTPKPVVVSNYDYNMAAKENEENYLLYEEARNNEKIAQQDYHLAAQINDILKSFRRKQKFNKRARLFNKYNKRRNVGY